MRINKLHILVMLVCWAFVAAVFPEELRAMFTQIIRYLGPMGYVLLPISAYLLVLSTIIIKNRHHYTEDHKQAVLEHLDSWGEKAAVCGLLGTILAMMSSSGSGAPDMSRFLQSLVSTFFGSGLSFLTSALYETMTRPRITPIAAKERHNAGLL